MHCRDLVARLVGLAATLAATSAGAAGYYAKASLQLHAAPAETSAVDPAVVPVGTLVDDVEPPATRDAWVRVHWRSDGADHEGWIPRNLLAGAGDFRKVSSCWPVQRSAATSGEAPWDVDFSMDGSATMQSENGGPPIHGHVYRAGNIVFVRASRKVPDSVSIFGAEAWGLGFVFDDRTSRLQALDYDSKTILRSAALPAKCLAPRAASAASGS